MTPQPIKTALVALMTMLVLGCSNYDVSVNERTVYTTEPLFADFDIADPALNQCVSEAVERKKVTSASRLVELNCNARGIENLAGIGVFTGLEQLQLADNAISDISPLAPLSSLAWLVLDNNNIADPTPLYELLSLRKLSLRNNPGLNCPNLSALLRVDSAVLPTHCPQ